MRKHRETTPIVNGERLDFFLRGLVPNFQCSRSSLLSRFFFFFFLISFWCSFSADYRLVPFDLKGEEQIANRVQQQSQQADGLREKVLTVRSCPPFPIIDPANLCPPTSLALIHYPPTSLPSGDR